MTERPELSEEEYQERITEMAKHAIREYCVAEDGAIQPDRAHLAAVETAQGADLIETHPLSVFQYRTDNASFSTDSRDYLTNMERMWGHLLTRALTDTLEERINELLNGEWDAVQTVEKSRTVTEEVTKLDE